MGLFGDDNSSMDAIRRAQDQNRAIYNQIELPKYKEWVPDLYNTESANYALTEDDPVVKSMQMQSLARMAGLADTGQSDVDAAGFDAARSLGDQQAKAGTAAAIQDAQNRGVAGSGQEFAMREMANQGGAERAHTAALEQASNAAKQRALYAQAYGSQVAGARDQDARTASANTNIINQFNQANTQQRNQTANANVGLHNQAFQYNQDLKDKSYQNQLGKAGIITGINTQAGAANAAQAEAERKRQQALAGMAGGVVGGAFGGPTGAAVGSGVGTAIA